MVIRLSSLSMELDITLAGISLKPASALFWQLSRVRESPPCAAIYCESACTCCSSMRLRSLSRLLFCDMVKKVVTAELYS